MRYIGLIGVGTIGRIYAINLLRFKKTLRIFDLNQKKAKFLESEGVIFCQSPREVAEKSEIVILALPNSKAVEDAVLGSNSLLEGVKKREIVLDLSTIDPATSVKMANALRKRGAYYLDAPISGGAPLSGGTEGAKKRNVTFLVGGNRAAYLRALPVMKLLGKRFFHLGGSGAGSTLKILSNMVNGVIAVSIAEALALGIAAGIEPRTLISVFDATDANNYFLQDYLAPRLSKGDYAPGFTMELQRKDHRLASALGRRYGVPLLMNEIAMQAYEMAINSGFSGSDYSSIHLFWRKFSRSEHRRKTRKNRNSSTSRSVPSK